MQRAVRSTLYPVLLLVLSWGCHASESFQQRLEEADALRSTNPTAFSLAVSRLRRDQHQASTDQLHHLRFLEAYQEGYQGRFDRAIESLVELDKTVRDPNLKVRVLILIANSAAATRNFPVGLEYLDQALELAGTPQVSASLRRSTYAVGALLYNQLGQYDLGMRYADLAYSEEDSPRQRCAARQLYLEAAFGLGEWPSSDDAANSAIEYCTRQGELGFSNLIRTYLARNLAGTGRRKAARLLLEAHIKEVSETRYPRLIGEFHSLLAEYSLDAGMLGDAEHHANTALEASRNNAFSLPRVAAHRVLYEIALERGNLQRALDEYRSYAEADKAYLDDIKARELAVQQSRNEVQQKDQAIALLSKQNEVLKLEQQVAKAAAQNTRLLLLLLAVVIAGIGYWAYKIKRVQMAFRRQAQTDGLTGISNRRHFRDEADALLRRCSAAGRDAALVLLDLDNFKHINDRHGHAAGDRVLEQVAEACASACREGDLCGRLGGEEFGILSCGGDIDAARRIAGRCRELLAAIDTSPLGLDRPVTASFGCTASSRSGHAFEAMFSDADAALYRAKHGGRDRIEIHGTAPPQAPAAAAARLQPDHG